MDLADDNGPKMKGNGSRFVSLTVPLNMAGQRAVSGIHFLATIKVKRVSPVR
ncbi:hypothetical protein [Maribacter sp. 2307ULW6-5]|uniref:hypothetical protein n=1 Tax=Maribacter sp. 2307ULW6-5 TaxID=3386275 RepID=UPI0039BCB435